MALKQNTPFSFSLPNLAGGKSSKTASQLRDNQADECRNVLFIDGAINDRPGQAKLYTTSLGAGATHCIDAYKKPDGTWIRLIHHGTKLYTQTGASDCVEVHTGLADEKGTPFSFNGNWYYINGTDFIKYDGTTFSDATDSAYIPTIYQGRKPDGTSGTTAKEQLNYLSNSFKTSFSSDGNAVYKLPKEELKQTGPLTSVDSIEVNGSAVSTGFTVDLTAWEVTFTSGIPASGGTNNVIIQATLTGLMDKTKITKNKYAGTYANRIWLAGDDNIIYYSGLTGDYTKDGSYFPEDAWRLTEGSDAVTAFSVHNNELIVLKEESIEGGKYSLENGTATFTWRSIISPGNNESTIICDMPWSVKIINNMVTFGSSLKGPGILRSTVSLNNELAVDWIGENINGTIFKSGLLNEQVADLKNATAVDDGSRYWLCVGNKAWVWDYTNSPYSPGMDVTKLMWWPQTNINANCWLVQDQEVYFGDRTSGIVWRFTPGTYSDNGTAISSLHRGKRWYFDTSKYYKSIRRVYVVIKAGTNSDITVKHISDKEIKTETISASSLNSFSFATARFDTGTFNVDNNDMIVVLSPRIKNTSSYQIEFSNNIAGQNLAIVSYELEVILGKQIK